ncbi:taurine ABC transporter substrate-binding protein [Advenella mimigardefordensis]|uniref:Taurine-binding periplasmic protein TauA n=1 Tax=Advenella mimigardefordensis (strain DSM 17166 / LMG 22922 / DPN7) TaxID=1247726 RepID=W0PAP4_ADVMD|nr:taurine ABC transporter substrate-binding protein [Advenella mimigardefordensis]AHG62567.1 taurine-binding periplasmic protein TauA [Advenella mimigardefordensis DPN7]
MNKPRRVWLKQTIMLVLTAVMGTTAYAQNKEVVIGYQDMVVPWRYAQETRLLEERTGYKVTYRQIGSGADVVRALASGAIDIGEAGSSPFAAGLSQGVPIELFWVLDNINQAEALVARKEAGIASVADLKGKKIALPFASTTHFHLLVALENAGIQPNEVQILNLRPPEVLAAWQRGDIDATFIWNPVLQQVKENGKVLLTSGEIAKATGKATFDAIAVRKDFAKDNDDFLTAFVKVLADSDKDYVGNTARWTADSAQAKAVAKWSGAEAGNVPDSLALYSFVAPAEQAGKQWLGGGKDSVVVQSLAATSEFLKKQGTIGSTLQDYSAGVNPRWVERAAQGQ